MMVNKQKQKGSRWERDVVDLFNEHIGGEWKRIPTSGAIGTLLNESKLTGDVVGRVDYISLPFKLEAKVGYGGADQLTIKREWLEKIKREAEADHSYPALVAKFSGSRGDIKHMIIFDFETFVKLMEEIEGLYEEASKLYEKS